MSGGLRRTWLIFRREWTQRVRTRTFRISTVLSVLAIVALVVLPERLGGDSETRTVALAGETPSELPALLRRLDQGFDLEVTTSRFDTVAQGEDAVRSEAAAVLVVDGEELVWKADPDPRVRFLVTSTLRYLDQQRVAAELGLAPDEAARLVDPEAPPSRSLEPVTEERSARVALATISMILLFVAISLYGGFLLVGVIEEKSSRVVEVLLSRIRPTELMAGKIAGIGAVGMAQFAAIAVAAVAALRFEGSAVLPETTVPTIAGIVLWFVLGYAFYSVLYAAAGSLVSRQEEAQTLAFPISAVMLVAYLVAFGILENPDSTFAVIGSLLPPSAPMFMIVRIADGGVPWWQTALAVSLMLASILGMVLLAARVYAGALLRIGPRVKLREAWAAGRSG